MPTPEEQETPDVWMDATPKQRALAIHLEIAQDDVNAITESTYDSSQFEYGSQAYLVYTASEADQAQDEQLTSYINDCMEIPDHLRPYFDEEKWKSDARMDGRGRVLSSYDGTEYEVTDPMTGELFAIYRTN